MNLTVSRIKTSILNMVSAGYSWLLSNLLPHTYEKWYQLGRVEGFLYGSAGKQYVCNAGHTSLVSGSGRSPGGRHNNLLQYSCLENAMDKGAWQATVQSVTKEQLGTHTGYVEIQAIEHLTHSSLNNREP